MFERFTQDSREAVVLARKEARDLGHGQVDTDHLLLALLTAGEGAAARALRSYGLNAEGVRGRIATQHERVRSRRHPRFTRDAKKALEQSLRVARRSDHKSLTSGHLLLGLLEAGESRALRTLATAEVDLARLRDEVTRQI